MIQTRLAQNGQRANGMMAHMLRLRQAGFADQKLLAAVEATKRDLFVPVSTIHLAWLPFPLPLPCGQTMPSPVATAAMVSALRLNETCSVLEIGTGSAYQTALIARLAKKIHSVERYRTLADQARKVLTTLEVNNATVALADGSTAAGRKGPGGQALYDRIITDCAFEDLPRDLLDQLASTGLVVAPIGPATGVQTVARLTKVGSRFERENLFEIRSTPLERGLAVAL